MAFKEMEHRPQLDEIAPPMLMPGEFRTCTDLAGEEGTAADESKARSFKQDHTDEIYPSDPKLALLIMSVFVGMFLVSLVRWLPTLI